MRWDGGVGPGPPANDNLLRTLAPLSEGRTNPSRYIRDFHCAFPVSGQYTPKSTGWGRSFTFSNLRFRHWGRSGRMGHWDVAGPGKARKRRSVFARAGGRKGAARAGWGERCALRESWARRGRPRRPGERRRIRGAGWIAARRSLCRGLPRTGPATEAARRVASRRRPAREGGMPHVRQRSAMAVPRTVRAEKCPTDGWIPRKIQKK